MFGSQVKDWIRNRAIHLSDEKAAEVAKKVGISVEQERAMEAALADVVCAAVDAL
jgi:hypothetical protein